MRVTAGMVELLLWSNMNITSHVRVGTCSWKYDSWRGLIYPESGPLNYLGEYSRCYNTVEVDQWFWSLFAGNKVVLPRSDTVREYNESVPDTFVFGIKVPNSITLTHFYKKTSKEPLEQNPHFLSLDLLKRFLETIEPLGKMIGPLIFQFEYLNKKKMSGQAEFVELLADFFDDAPKGYTYCLEIRNPNYLNEIYFKLLREKKINPVFLHGYYMPSIFEVYQQYQDYVGEGCVIRLHGRHREEIEKETNKNWSRIVMPQDKDLRQLSAMLEDLESRGVPTFLFVNNHFEGSAPTTIVRIQEVLDS